MPHCFNTYSNCILSYRLEGQDQAETFSSAVDIEAVADKHLQLAERRNAGAILLFGAADAGLAEVLAAKKNSNLELIICDLYPEHIRQLQAGALSRILQDDSVQLLTDSSIWAHLLLLNQNGYSAENSHLILNPSLIDQSRNKHSILQRLVSGSRPVSIPESGPEIKFSAGAILSPDEPRLEEYIRHLPEWIDEIVLVWDSDNCSNIPDFSKFHDAKIINICHSLDADFSKQRNIMLKNCSGEWIIYLDADERLDSESWDRIRKTAGYEGCSQWFLPRMTFYPDSDHCRTGYGLWPDLQLRLFRKSAGLRFVNKIHERLTGMEGPAGIIPSCPINHLTHLLKSREIIESKLESFNKSTEGSFRHQLGKDFPNVANKLLRPSSKRVLKPLILPDIKLQ